MMSALTHVDVVLEQLLDGCRCLVPSEIADIRNCAGRTLSEDLISAINVPLVDNSAMDGYAIHVNGLQPGAVLPISARIPAGTNPYALAPNTAARIFTGAPLPAGADTVIMQEDTELTDSGVKLLQLPVAGSNVRPAGQDIQQGARVLQAGRILRAQDLGLLASIGFKEVPVRKRLKVAIMSTGDELVEPPASLKPGQIFNSNHYTLQGMLEAIGMEVVDLGLVRDDPAATLDALKRGAGSADCIISSGGVSVGEEDHVKAAVEALGELNLWRLAIKPGKPLAFGRIGDTPFFGLPGNPVSSFVTFAIIAKPYLLKAQGSEPDGLDYIYASAGFAFKGGSRREYLRVQVTYNADGSSSVKNFSNQGSGVMSSVSWANGLAEIEIDQQVVEGDLVKVYLI